MKFWEAMKLLEEGKKMRPVGDCDLPNSLEYARHVEWELYQEPLKMFPFCEIIKELVNGKKFKRKKWADEGKDGSWIAYIHPKYPYLTLYKEDFEATDWIEVKE